MCCLIEEYVQYLNYWDSVHRLPSGWFRKNKKESKQYLTEQNSIIESLSLLQKQQKSIEEKLNWIKNRETLFFEKEKAQNDLTKIRQELLEAQPRFNYLQRIDCIQPIKEYYLKLKTAEEQHIKAKVQVG